MQNYKFINLIKEKIDFSKMSAKDWWKLEKKLKPKFTSAQKKVRDRLRKGWKIWIVGEVWYWKEPKNEYPENAGSIYKAFNNYIMKIGKLAGVNQAYEYPKEFMYKPKKKKVKLVQKEGKGKNIYVVDERHVGKHRIILMQDPKTSTMRTAIMHKDKINRYNRNKQEDIDKLWALAKKYKGKEIKEGKSDYEIYHDLYGNAINEIEKFADKNGYTIDEDEFSDIFLDAFNKPRKGKTYRTTLTLYKNGKQQRKALHSQIYNRGTKRNEFELNMYIS